MALPSWVTSTTTFRRFVVDIACACTYMCKEDLKVVHHYLVSISLQLECSLAEDDEQTEPLAKTMVVSW